MSNFHYKLTEVAKSSNQYLKKFFMKQDQSLHLLKPMRYGALYGGKRFRSTIIVNTGKIYNINYRNLIIIGAAVECIHSYSLIHDDLPSMDNDDFRRGNPSTHKKFGESNAILAGNSLLTSAFEILTGKDLKLSNDIKTELVYALSKCSGIDGIAGGQYYDLSFENKKISKKRIIDMQLKKTGKLFSFCCESSAIIKRKRLKERNFLKQIGLEIGLLFQIADDLIDSRGDAKVVGKPTRNDKSKGKATLVNLLGYEETLNFAKKLKNKINAKIKKYGYNSRDLLQSVKFILEREF